MTPLAEQAALYAAENAASAAGITPLPVLLARAYMAGALEAARYTPHEAIRQCIDFGRAIGSAAERAQA